jgi:acetylornithine/succinyldiaminopimelate/putrescine aminotransferase
MTNRQLFLRYLAQTSDAPVAIEVNKAEGVYIFGRDNKKYIDLISGISVSSLGHRHPAVINAINDQTERYLHLMVYGEYIQTPQVELAALLIAQLPDNLDNVYLVNSGSEAIEGALKLAKRVTSRPGMISFRNAYHGHTQGAMSMMGGEYWKQQFRPLIPGVTFLTFNNFEDIDLIDENSACVLVEPVQAEGGIIVPVPGFLEAIRERCSLTGTLLIFDEVQTGFGRTGELFAFQKYGVVPDILVLAKSMGGGMPIGAFVSSKAFMSKFMDNPPLGHITTFGGHPVSAAAALANLSVLLSEPYISEVSSKEQLIISLLRSHPAIKEIRSSGLMIAVELGDEALVKRLATACIKSGVIVDWFLFCDTAIRIAPPLIITADQIRDACEIFLDVLNSILD